MSRQLSANFGVRKLSWGMEGCACLRAGSRLSQSASFCFAIFFNFFEMFPFKVRVVMRNAQVYLSACASLKGVSFYCGVIKALIKQHLQQI